MNRQENIPINFNGKQYTKYEALQRQRQLETRMRAERQKIKLLQDGGVDETDIMLARAKYRGTSQEYTSFSKAMDLPQQRQRVTVDGLGNIGVGKWKIPVEKSGKSGIIEITKNAVGHPVKIVKRNEIHGESNGITQKENSRGGIERNYYDGNGNQIKQVSNNNHGNPKKHPYGKNGEHTHNYIYDENGNLIGRPMRELTDEERKENEDIL